MDGKEKGLRRDKKERKKVFVFVCSASLRGMWRLLEEELYNESEHWTYKYGPIRTTATWTALSGFRDRGED